MPDRRNLNYTASNARVKRRQRPVLRRPTCPDPPSRLLACVLRAVHVAMRRHVTTAGAGGGDNAHFHLRRTQIVDRNQPRIEYSRRPFAQSAPIAGAMRGAAEPLLLASVNAQAGQPHQVHFALCSILIARSAPADTVSEVGALINANRRFERHPDLSVASGGRTR